MVIKGLREQRVCGRSKEDVGGARRRMWEEQGGGCGRSKEEDVGGARRRMWEEYFRGARDGIGGRRKGMNRRVWLGGNIPRRPSVLCMIRL